MLASNILYHFPHILKTQTIFKQYLIHTVALTLQIFIRIVIDYQMDLSQIFKEKTHMPAPSRLSLSSMSSTRNNSSPSQQWNLDHLENSMRKGVKKQVTEQSMREQLKIFYKKQKDILLSKSLIVAFSTILLIYFVGIEGPIAFTGIMLAAIQLIFKLVIPANMRSILDNLRAIQPLIYCSIFYSLLKCTLGMNNAIFHWPITVVSILATFAHVIIKIYQPYTVILASKFIGEMVVEKKAVKKILPFWKYEVFKITTLRNMAIHFIFVLSLVSIAFFGILSYFGLLSIENFQIRYFLSSIFVFFSLQIYLDFIAYINLTFSHDLKILKIMLDKLPIFINLLRLKKQPANQQVFPRLYQIHNDCLKYLFIKISEVNNFLSTETFKSLIYTTYMDIFNQYASLELERLNFDLMNFLAKVKLNDVVVRSEKTMANDILIYFRKFSSYVVSEWELSKTIKELSSMNYLFLVINKIKEDSRNEQERISRRAINLLLAIRQKLIECSKRQSLTLYSRKQIEQSQQILTAAFNNE